MFQYPHRDSRTSSFILGMTLALFVALIFASPTAAQRDPAEPPGVRTVPKSIPRPAGAIVRTDIDKAGMRSLIEQLVACGTRNSLSSWDDPKHGIGCGLERVGARLKEISHASADKLQIVVDKFDASSDRTNGKPVPFENVYAVLPGTDPTLAKTIFIVSGHIDSRASDVMDPQVDAPGADDDASG